jgi:single-strand DNA-binding protein
MYICDNFIISNMILAHIVGHLGKDAETKTVGESTVIQFSIASNSRRKIEGEYQNITDWVQVSHWANEKLASYLKKGVCVAVSGELILDSYTDKEGVKRANLKLIATNLQFTGKLDKENGGEAKTNNPALGVTPENVAPEDLPF